jgi:hypothetical protein
MCKCPLGSTTGFSSSRPRAARRGHVLHRFEALIQIGPIHRTQAERALVTFTIGMCIACLSLLSHNVASPFGKRCVGAGVTSIT